MLYELYVVMVSNDFHEVTLYGNTEGFPFTNKAKAERKAMQMSNLHPTLDFMVMCIKQSTTN